MASSFLTQVSLLDLVLSVLIYSQSELLGGLVGRVKIDETRLQRWANSAPVNNANCKVFDVADACEDVKIHHSSNTAFLTCGNPFERTNWFPAAGVRHPERRAEGTYQEFLFKHDLGEGKTVQLKIEGLEGDFITHGMDIYNFPDDPAKVRFFRRSRN